jgi:hypothetical protein
MVNDSKISAELLLGRGFLPKELPPCFTTEAFAKFVGQQARLPSVQTTRPGIHNLARPGGQRRRLHLPNPFNYAHLTKLITDNWTKLERHFAKSTLSVSTPILDLSEMRAVKSKRDGLELAKHRAKVRTGGRFILKTDIARFYGSIYTHSIPWALEGKTKAKTFRYGGFANNLDLAIREMQDGQTLGIPTGPDASFILSEIIATAVDQKLQQAGISGMRYIDDYELIFPSRSAAEAGLAKLEQFLWDFELAINLRKTSIEELPVDLDRRWTSELRQYPFRDVEVSAEELIDYFGRAFALKAQNPHDPVLAYAVARLRTLEIEEWELLQNLISQCALAEHGAMEALVTHYFLNSDDAHGPALDRVIANILEEDSVLALGTEVSWALWTAIWFQRRIASKLAKRLDGNPDPVVAVLALYAKSLGLIKKSVSFPIWASWMRASSLSGPQWLLAYEADIKGWLPSAEKPNHVDSVAEFLYSKKPASLFLTERSINPPEVFYTQLKTRSPPFSVDPTTALKHMD